MRLVETLRASHPHLNVRGFYTRTAPLDRRALIRSFVQLTPEISLLVVLSVCRRGEGERGEGRVRGRHARWANRAARLLQDLQVA
jgi:hypothetical protein